MYYNLSGEDHKKIRFIKDLAKTILYKLEIPYTDEYLLGTIEHSYAVVFEVPPPGPKKEILVADKQDASNLCIVLLDALKKYHVKQEMTELGHTATSSFLLAILRNSTENQGYEDLLKIVTTDPKNKAFSSLFISPNFDTGSTFEVENYISLTKSEFSAEPGYSANKRRRKSEAFFLFFASAVLLITLCLALFDGFAKNNLFLLLPELLTSFIGVFLSYQLYILDKPQIKKTMLSNKFCSDKGRSGLNCSKVLSSRGSKLFGVVSWVDVGCIYFSVIFLWTLLILLLPLPNRYISILFWLSAASLPYTIYSIIYQFNILKSFCAFCISTQLILWIQFGVLLGMRRWLTIFPPPLPAITAFSLLTILVSLAYFLNDKVREWKTRSKEQAYQLAKYNSDEALFNLALSRQPTLVDAPIPVVIDIGNKSATLRLTAILSLFCMPCYDMLKRLLKLADWYEGRILITISIPPGQGTKDLICRLLDLENKPGKTQIPYLMDWYAFFSTATKNKTSSPEDLIMEWKSIRPSDCAVDEKALIYNNLVRWHGANQIQFTPSLIYNDRFLPTSVYDLEVFYNIWENHEE